MKLDQRIVCRQLPPRCDMGSGEADVPVPSANTGIGSVTENSAKMTIYLKYQNRNQFCFRADVETLKQPWATIGVRKVAKLTIIILE